MGGRLFGALCAIWELAALATFVAMIGLVARALGA